MSLLGSPSTENPARDHGRGRVAANEEAMSYTTSDFSESLNRVGIQPSSIETVIAAWGGGDGQGADMGKGWSAEGVTDWAGGFLFRLKDGRVVYVQGWCDYTGWGCQISANVQYFDAVPPLADVRVTSEDGWAEPRDWDESPADLNLWLQRGAKDPLE
jgi:hypothetical protein